MDRAVLEKELHIVEMREKKFLQMHRNSGEMLRNAIYKRIPPKLEGILQQAFLKAFKMVFEKGSGLIEKTVGKDDLLLEHEVNNFRLEKKSDKRSLKKVGLLSKKRNRTNVCVTTVEGIGFGLLGVGIPDIPVFLAILLKGVYEISASYGIDYSKKEEQVFILRLIAAALADEERRNTLDAYVEEWARDEDQALSFEKDLEVAAERLADSMLIAKFVQGFFVVGMLGGVMNPMIYGRVTQYAVLKYKKRYLMQKLMKTDV